MPTILTTQASQCKANPQTMRWRAFGRGASMASVVCETALPRGTNKWGALSHFIIPPIANLSILMRTRYIHHLPKACILAGSKACLLPTPPRSFRYPYLTLLFLMRTKGRPKRIAETSTFTIPGDPAFPRVRNLCRSHPHPFNARHSVTYGCFFRFDSVIYIPLHAARRAMAAAGFSK